MRVTLWYLIEDSPVPFIRTILHPTDLSEQSRTAFELASALAHDFGAELVVLHVYPEPINGAEAVDRTRDDGLEEDLGMALRKLVPSDPTIPVDYHLEEGDPAKTILKASSKCDLIVMGTHGRRGIKRALLGSVAEKVLREARCPVVTVRPTAHLGGDKPDSLPEAAAGWH